MSRNNTTINIHGKIYNTSNLKMLLGIEESITLEIYQKEHMISNDLLNIAYILDKPSRLPIMLREIYHIPGKENEEIRLALARAQIDSLLNMNQNLEKNSTQKYVSETIEKLIFGELLLNGKSQDKERRDKNRQKKVKNKEKKGKESNKINEKKKRKQQGKE